jgi:hypothetical protein
VRRSTSENLFERGDEHGTSDTPTTSPHTPVGPTAIGNLLPIDRPWHLGKTRGELSVTSDDGGHVYMTTVSGQTRTVTPYDYRMTEHAESAETSDG